MKDLRWTGVQVLLGVVWLLITTHLHRTVPGPVGVLLAALWPLLFLGLGFAVVWWRGRVLRRRLLEQEFRD